MTNFQPYDPRQPVTQSRRHLPHRQQPGATYFVTFRLADSLPAEARTRLAELRDLDTKNGFDGVDAYLDAGSGSCLFAQPDSAELMATALRYFDGHRYELGAFVVMPNHVHALVQPIQPYTRAQVIHSWKSYTAHELQRRTAVRGQIWQDEGFDHIVRDEAALKRFHQYILANPTAAKLQPGEYIFGEGKARWFPSG